MVTVTLGTSSFNQGGSSKNVAFGQLNLVTVTLGTHDGIYSVKSGYHAIKQWEEQSRSNPESSSSTNDTAWQKLWNQNIPPKYAQLVWRILNNGLPVKANLVKRGVRSDPMCPRCGDNFETIYHAFMECDWSKHAWFASSLNLNFSNISQINFIDWLRDNLRNKDQRACN